MNMILMLALSFSLFLIASIAVAQSRLENLPNCVNEYENSSAVYISAYDKGRFMLFEYYKNDADRNDLRMALLDCWSGKAVVVTEKGQNKDLYDASQKLGELRVRNWDHSLNRIRRSMSKLGFHASKSNLGRDFCACSKTVTEFFEKKQVSQ